MRAPEGEWRKLEQLERKAKKQRIGGWGIGTGSLHLRATARPRPSTDFFDALIYPNAAAASERQMPGSDARLEINAASKEALQSIAGVGKLSPEGPSTHVLSMAPTTPGQRGLAKR